MRTTNMRISMTQCAKWLSSIAVLILTALCCVVGKLDLEKRCDTCKDVVKSFNEGLERTSRYNFAGGDTEWEEKKLGSYATSETRFIEIIETVCKSSNFECNNFLEEKEELLEDWWSNHQHKSDVDFVTWLCIDNAKVCCPDNHYGPNCDECFGGITRLCSGNGKCKGGGTRGGTGKCKCNAGYKGDLCNVCKKGFYEESKNETDIICKACHESCASTCDGAGPKACTKCKGGWAWSDESGCSDVNECQGEKYPCQTGEFCENNEGSYKCEKCDFACEQCLGDGPSKCLSCRLGYSMTEENVCEDVDECASGKICQEDHMICNNTPGSYYCDCEEDYAYTGDACVEKLIFSDENKTDEDKDSNTEQADSDDQQPQPSVKSLELNGGTTEESQKNTKNVKIASDEVQDNVKLKEEGQVENNLSSSGTEVKQLKERSIDDKTPEEQTVEPIDHIHSDL